MTPDIDGATVARSTLAIGREHAHARERNPFRGVPLSLQLSRKEPSRFCVCLILRALSKHFGRISTEGAG